MTERLRGISVVALGVFWLVVALYALHPIMAFNPLSLPFEADLRIQRWTPEGWKFFTRNPREDHTLIFSRQSDGAWSSAGLGPNFTFGNLLGWSRRPRAQGIELALLLYRVPKERWGTCADAPTQCLEQTKRVLSLVNRSPEPSICGTVGVALQEQIPWAWALQAPVMPSRVLRLDVRC